MIRIKNLPQNIHELEPIKNKSSRLLTVAASSCLAVIRRLIKSGHFDGRAWLITTSTRAHTHTDNRSVGEVEGAPSEFAQLINAVIERRDAFLLERLSQRIAA